MADSVSARLDALENRVAKIEEKLENKTGKRCPGCGGLNFRASKTGEDEFGNQIDLLHCPDCKYQLPKVRDKYAK